jgi:hypothetical protein
MIQTNKPINPIYQLMRGVPTKKGNTESMSDYLNQFLEERKQHDKELKKRRLSPRRPKLVDDEPSDKLASEEQH